jgi:hypothetical protein
MADPVLPDIFKCQAILRGASGLPEDVFINNWYFRNDGTLATGPEIHTAIKKVLDSFYITPAANGSSVSGFFPLGVVSPMLYRIYDLGQPPPRTRNQLESAPLAASRTTPLPYEVSLCLSFYAGQNVPRRRGRIYVGPFGTKALVGSTGNLPLPDATLTAALVDRASAVGRTTENVTWVMVTRGGTVAPFEPANARVITAGWVDSAWDTQRRRGLAATGRTTFSAV